MKHFILIIMMTTAAPIFAQNGKAETVKKTFSRQTSISININADAPTIWNILTNASDFPRWNSTVTSLEGTIALGEKIRLKSTLDEKRTFKLKVKEMEANKKMVWGDGKGNRVYSIKPNAAGGFTFSMNEKIGGLMFPMYAGYIPPFDESFEQFAADLKTEAEKVFNSK